MALRKILTIDTNEAELRRVAKPVTVFDKRLGELVDDLFETMYATDDGAGLASTQVGVLKRVVVIDVGEEQKYELVNPIIEEAEGEAEYEEGCLSVPGMRGHTKRAQRVKVRAQDRTGHVYTVEGEGLLALALQHEIDHLDGKLYIDRAIGDLWEVEA